LKKNRPTKDHAAFQAEIVAVARRLFVEKGFEVTSMDDVAAVLRVSKPTVYEEFASKQSLFEAVVENAMLDFDLSWVEAAARREISFAAFMNRAPAEVIRLMSSPKCFELLRLAMRDGSLVRRMSPSLFERAEVWLLAPWDRLIASAMQHGECRRMEPLVVRRLLFAPFVLIAYHFTMLGEAIDIKMNEAYLEEYYRMVGDFLLVRPDA
jgi:AcrR family transcriptional regulator